MINRIIGGSINKFKFSLIHKCFSKAMIMEKNTNLRISQDKDIDEELKKEITTISGNVYLDIRSSELSNEKFKELFAQLSKAKPSNFRLDLSEIVIDDDKAIEISKCLENWDLSKLDVFMSSIKMTDSQFEKIISSLPKMKNLKNLHLEIENVYMNHKKLQHLEDTLKKMKNLDDVYINIRRNNITAEDVRDINYLISSISNRYFLF